MKLIIAGSRTFNFYTDGISVSTGELDTFLNIHGIWPDEVVCGCGGTDEEKAFKKEAEQSFASDQGVDLWGEYWADTNHVPIKRIPARWKKEGRPAGPKRNTKMAEYADELLLIWDGKSSGSANMKKEMLKLGKPVHEVIIKSSVE